MAYTPFAAIHFVFKRICRRFFGFIHAFFEMSCVWNVKMLDLFCFNEGRPLVNGGKEVAMKFCAVKNSQMSDLDDFLSLSTLQTHVFKSIEIFVIIKNFLK